MTDNLHTREQQRKRSQAVKTAWVLGFVAVGIFTAFIAAAVLGH